MFSSTSTVQTLFLNDHMSRHNKNTQHKHPAAVCWQKTIRLHFEWVCVWMGEMVSDERRELTVMLYWIQMRERHTEFWSGCLPLFLPPSLRVEILQRSASFWTKGGVIRSTFESQGPGFKGKFIIVVFFVWFFVLFGFMLVFFLCRLNKRLDFWW